MDHYLTRFNMAEAKDSNDNPERPSIVWLIKEVMDTLCLEDKVKNNKEGSSEESLEKRCSEVCKKQSSQKSVSPIGIKGSFEV